MMNQLDFAELLIDWSKDPPKLVAQRLTGIHVSNALSNINLFV